MATNTRDDTGQSEQPGSEPLNSPLSLLPRMAKAALAPAAAALATWAVTANPVLVLAVVLPLSALQWFAVRYWRERKLGDRLFARVADPLDLRIDDLLSGHRRRYLRSVIFEHRNFDVKGLSTQSAFTLELEHVFVDLSVAPIAPHDASADMIRKLPAELQKGGHALWDFLETVADGGPANLAILGAPGSGKTTLLKHVALTFAHGRSPTRSLSASSNLPILLFLRDHAAAIAEDPDGTRLSELVAAHHRAESETEIPAAWFEDRLRRNRCLVMLDGLDEVADAEARKAVVKWAERQMTKVHGGNRFLITSRPYAYRDNPLAGVTVLDVRPFSAEQVQDFVHKWYLANEIKAQRSDDEGVRRDARKGARDLLARLAGAPALSDLAVSPLLLTMIATIHRFRSSLPGRRVELYAEICEVSLGKRQRAKGIELDLTPAQKQVVLEPMAWHMMEAKERELAAEKAMQIIARPLKKVNPKTTPRDFLADVEQSSSLLLERGDDVYGFAHITFQEFLAACHAERANLAERLVGYVRDPWWRETLRLYAARKDATPILQACMTGDPPDPAALSLAFECREEAKEIDPQVRTDLDRFVRAGLDEMDPARRRPVAEALLKVRLGRLRRLDEGRYIDPELVTRVEYQLFLDEMRARGENRQPDHWPALRFAPGEAREPIIGVRFSDALAFCDWLTEREAGGWYFRPPTVEEETAIRSWTDAAESTPWRLVAPGDRVAEPWPAAISVRIGDLRGKATDALAAAFDRTIGPDFDRTRDFGRDLDLSLKRDLAVVRSLAGQLGPDLDLVLEVALDRARDVARQLARDLARDLGNVSEFARALDPDLNPDLTAESALDLGRDVALALDRALGTDRDRVLSLDLALDLALAFDRAFGCERTFDLARAVACVVGLSRAAGSGHGRDLVRALALALCYTLALAFILNLCTLAELVRRRNRGFATQIEAVNMYHQRVSTCLPLMALILGLTGIFENRTRTFVDAQTNWLRLLRGFVIGKSFGRRFADLSGKADSKDEAQDAITFARTVFYLAFAFKRSRLAGEDRPFEALRIVREHVGTTLTKAKF